MANTMNYRRDKRQQHGCHYLIPLGGAFTGGDHAFDTRHRSAQIDVGNN